MLLTLTLNRLRFGLWVYSRLTAFEGAFGPSRARVRLGGIIGQRFSVGRLRTRWTVCKYTEFLKGASFKGSLNEPLKGIRRARCVGLLGIQDFEAAGLTRIDRSSSAVYLAGNVT